MPGAGPDIVSHFDGISSEEAGVYTLAGVSEATLSRLISGLLGLLAADIRLPFQFTPVVVVPSDVYFAISIKPPVYTGDRAQVARIECDNR